MSSLEEKLPLHLLTDALAGQKLEIKRIYRWAGMNPFKRELALRLWRHKIGSSRFTPLVNCTNDPVYCSYCTGHKPKPRPKCSGCRTVYYCGPSCQSKDWKLHKQVCDPDHCIAFVGRHPLIIPLKGEDSFETVAVEHTSSASSSSHLQFQETIPTEHSTGSSSSPGHLLCAAAAA